MSELELIDSILRHSLELQRLSAHEEAEALAVLRELEAELRRLLASRNLTDAGKRDIEALIREAGKAIDAHYAQIPELTDTHQLALIVADKTTTTLSTVIPSAVLPTAERLASLTTDVLIAGAPSSAWWARQAEDLQFRFAAEVRQGVVNGETNERIVGRIIGRSGEPGIMDLARRNARALVHSSIMTAANRARLEVYRKNRRYMKGLRWLATLDSHTCIQCIALDGEMWDLDGKPLGKTTMDFQLPPAHWNCFPGDTLVLAADGVTGASKRWFDGEVVIVKTAAGREFTCTPNHPILTDRGWLAAGLLDVGGNIVGYRGGDWVALTGGDGKNVPAPIHEIAEAVFAAELVSPVPMIPTAEDFHGDGEGSEIAIVWSDRLLSYAGDASLDQHLGEFGFIGGGLAGLVPFAGGGHSADYFERLDAPACCAVSLSDLSLALGRRHLGPLESLGLAVPALGDPMIPKNSGYDYSFNLELLGDSILRDAADVGPANRCLIDEGARPGWYAAMLQFAHDDAVRNPALAADLSGIEPGNVELDTVVELKRIGFSDHVYNLETSTGWYVAQGVVSHNCRCVATPIPKGIDEIFGTTGLDQQMQPQTRASKDGPTNAITFDAFLKRQSPEFVEDMLGAHRAAMWRAGKITLKDLVSGTGRPLTLAQLQAQ